MKQKEQRIQCFIIVNNLTDQSPEMEQHIRRKEEYVNPDGNMMSA